MSNCGVDQRLIDGYEILALNNRHCTKSRVLPRFGRGINLKLTARTGKPSGTAGDDGDDCIGQTIVQEVALHDKCRPNLAPLVVTEKDFEDYDIAARHEN